MIFTPAAPQSTMNAATSASSRAGCFAVPAMIAETRITITPANASSPERESVASSVAAAQTPSSRYAAAAFIRLSIKLA